MKKTHAIIVIVISIVISFILAVTVDMSHYELAALVNFFWPPILGLLTILLFLLLWGLIKNKKIGIAILIILCLYNIYAGLALHLEKVNWPLLILW